MSRAVKVTDALVRDARVTLIVGGAAVALFWPCAVHADDWPHWRGPSRNGISLETTWSEQALLPSPVFAWKAKVGVGFSSFVVSAGRAYTMGHAEEKDTVFCLDAVSGKVIWQHSYPAELGDKYFDGGTTGTPTIDGDRVFSFSRWGDLFCFNAASGKVVWSKNIQKETQIRVPSWGYSGAPLVQDKLLVLNMGEYGVALDKASGNVVWQSPNKDCGYSTPLPIQCAGKTQLIFGSGQSYIGVDPSTGKELWRVRWITQYGVNAADPIVSGDQLFLSTGYGRGAGLFKLGTPEPENSWKSKVLRTQMNPAVLVDGHVYGIDGDTTDKASLKCVELATGKEKWAEPNIGSGALIVADRKLVVLSATGGLLVAPVSPDSFKATARAHVLDGKCWTAPVLANGRIYCRNAAGDAVCVDVRKK